MNRRGTTPLPQQLSPGGAKSLRHERLQRIAAHVEQRELTVAAMIACGLAEADRGMAARIIRELKSDALTPSDAAGMLRVLAEQDENWAELIEAVS